MTGGSWDRWCRKNTDTLFELAGMGLGKPEPTWSWDWQVTWRATRASTSTSAAKVRQGKRWGHCSMGQQIWWQRTWKRLRNFVLVFTGKMCLEESEASQITGKFWSNEYFFLTEENQVREHLNKLDIDKSMRPDGMHTHVFLYVKANRMHASKTFWMTYLWYQALLLHKNQ